MENKITYVFSPEEPELIMVLGDSKYFFAHGRIDSARYPNLTENEIGRFAANGDFIVTQNLDDPKLRMLLQERVLATAGRGAGATNINTMMEASKLMLAFMLTPAGASEIVDIRLEPGNVIGLAAATQPQIAQTLSEMADQSMNNAEIRSVETAEIVEAAAGQDLDEIQTTPTTEAEEIAEASKPLDVPAEFSPPVEETEPVAASLFG